MCQHLQADLRANLQLCANLHFTTAPPHVHGPQHCMRNVASLDCERRMVDTITCAVQPEEIEEFYNRTPEPNATQIEKHYYLVITLAGHGILACEALRSGSRNVKQPGNMVYWFDRLVELGIGTAELEAELRARVWKVRADCK